MSENTVRYYMHDPTAEHGVKEVSKEEWLALNGDKTIRPYARQVYRGEMALTDVPEEHRAAVQAVVEEKTRRYGPYSEREISPRAALNILTGGDIK